MRNPRNFAHPLAIGAPKPWNDIPVRPSRMIHFFDPSNPRMAVKVPDIIKKVDVILAQRFGDDGGIRHDGWFGIGGRSCAVCGGRVHKEV